MRKVKIDSHTSPPIKITFIVNCIDMEHIMSTPQPDSNLENILMQLKSRTVSIQFVPRLLKHGDVFTLYGQEALKVYANYIGKKPKILEVYDGKSKETN
jgi:hypothetical protein